MSKFFKALERLEQERGAPPPADAASPSVADPPPAALAPPPAASPPATRTAAVDAPAAAGRPPADAAVPTTAAAADAPARAAGGATPASAEPAPAAERGGVYGAPHARDNGGSRFDLGTEPAVVDAESGQLDDHLVSLLEPTSFAAEQYRAVRLAIETHRRERGTRVVAVASPGRADGRTITAINLAGALAQSLDARVVLLEADLRHPAVSRYLGLAPRRGLSSYLLDPTMADEAILVQPAGVAFSVVPAGAASAMPYELLKAPRLAALLAALRARFDYVVVDTPPVLPFPDVGILRDAVDGFVVVVRANQTPREMLHDTVDVIGRQRALGLIFNDDDRRPGVAAATDRGGWRRYVAMGARVA